LIALEVIDGVGLPQVGLGSGWAAFLVVCLMFPLGRAYSRKQVEDLLAEKDRAIEDTAHDRNEWRAESRIKDAQIAEKDGQLRHMGEVGRSVESILGALQRNATKETP
jgi:hypothetical protein